MKKLMFSAVALCAAVGFSAVESDNVVGYQTKASASGFNFVAPTFDAVDGTGAIALQDIAISGDNVTDSSDNIQILDEGGATVSQYIYMTAATSALSADGWVDGDLWALTDATVPYGAGILLDTANAGVTVTFAGQVATTDSEIKSVSGFNFTGNNSPVSINVQDITVSGDVTDSSDNIQILDEGGATIAQYIYMTAATSGLAADGWVDGDAWALADVSLEPGQGILVDTANADVSIVIPSAL